MDFETYQIGAAVTRSGRPELTIAALGLCGESGEFADHIKKWLAQGHELDQDYIINELGDVLWYLSLASDAIGVPLSEIAEKNLAKLRARYPEGFEAERSINR